MVSIKDHSIGRLRSRRHRLRRYVISRVAAGDGLLQIVPYLRDYLRSCEEVRLSLRRSRHISTSVFNINAFNEEQSLSLFRFKPADLGRLASLLNVTPTFLRRRYNVPSVECLAIVLRRLASPCRWTDVEELFGRTVSSLSEIFHETVEHVAEKWGPVLTSWRGDLMAERAAVYAGAVAAKGAPLDRCVGFIDGTALRVSRPGNCLQRSIYSGHKRVHCIKFQSVTTPDGLIFNLFGPVEGRRHDMTLYHQSGMDGHLRDTLVVDGEQYYLYADAAYVLRAWLQIAFAGDNLTDAQAAYNTAMSALRVSVEWAFKDIKQVFSYLDYSRKLKLQEGPVGLLYLVAALLWNLRSCLYGSQTSSFFGCSPPSVEKYLGL